MNENLKILIPALIEKTNNEEIFWEKTSNFNEFKCQFRNGAAVTISSSYLRLYSEDGFVVDSLPYDSLNSLLDPELQIVKDLYDTIVNTQHPTEAIYMNIFKEIGLEHLS